MAAVVSSFKSREDRRKQLELEEARRAGMAPPEVDEDGKEINPHIPRYMSSAPWYLLNAAAAEKPSLKHQRKWKSSRLPNYTKAAAAAAALWYDRGAKVYQADKYRKGACENCGAMTHGKKSCMDRPRKLGAKWTNMHIAPDEKVETFELDYDAKRDRWNGYDHANSTNYAAARRRKFLKEQQQQQFKKLDQDPEDDDDEDDEEMKVDDEAMVVDESKQMDFARVVRTTGTVRNLRIREDTAKYLLNLDVNSAHYDPKTRSMREDPLPDNDKFYRGDNQYRVTGQAMDFKQLNVHAWEASQKGGQDIHMQAAPSQAELSFKNYKLLEIKEKLKTYVRH